MKVLLVDDEPDIRTIGRLSLERVGALETLVAASAEEALVIAAAERPDAILLDVIMPGTDGLAALALLRADPALRAIPVVFLTGNARPDEVARYLALGAVGVIAKPFDPLALPDQLRVLLAHQPITVDEA